MIFERYFDKTTYEYLENPDIACKRMIKRADDGYDSYPAGKANDVV